MYWAQTSLLVPHEVCPQNFPLVSNMGPKSANARLDLRTMDLHKIIVNIWSVVANNKTTA